VEKGRSLRNFDLFRQDLFRTLFEMSQFRSQNYGRECRYFKIQIDPYFSINYELCANGFATNYVKLFCHFLCFKLFPKTIFRWSQRNISKIAKHPVTESEYLTLIFQDIKIPPSTSTSISPFFSFPAMAYPSIQNLEHETVISSQLDILRNVICLIRSFEDFGRNLHVTCCS
jgi:hypothetical protein